MLTRIQNADTNTDFNKRLNNIQANYVIF